eukprot:701821-Pelagomonas_calceolata.AAC.8
MAETDLGFGSSSSSSYNSPQKGASALLAPDVTISRKNLFNTTQCQGLQGPQVSHIKATCKDKQVLTVGVPMGDVCCEEAVLCGKPELAGVMKEDVDLQLWKKLLAREGAASFQP